MLVCAKNSKLCGSSVSFDKNQCGLKPNPGYIAIVIAIAGVSPNCEIAIAVISDSQPVKDRAVFVNASRSADLKAVRAE
jgi:hypothetical protein